VSSVRGECGDDDRECSIAGGLGALMVKVFGRKNQTKKLFQKENPKEETW